MILRSKHEIGYRRLLNLKMGRGSCCNWTSDFGLASVKHCRLSQDAGCCRVWVARYELQSQCWPKQEQWRG